MVKKILWVSFACASVMVLSGCPLEVTLTLSNVTNEPIIITSTSRNLPLAPSQSVTVTGDDFVFDLGSNGAEMLKVRRGSGSHCYEIVFNGLGLKDSDLQEDGIFKANLAIASDGNVYVIPNKQSAVSVAKNDTILRAKPKLRSCAVVPALTRSHRTSPWVFCSRVASPADC